MKKFGYIECFYSIDKEKWYLISNKFPHYEYSEPRAEEIVTVPYEEIQKKAVFFIKRKHFLGDEYLYNVKTQFVIEKGRPLYIKKKWVETAITMDKLLKMVDAETFAEFLKDRGLFLT